MRTMITLGQHNSTVAFAQQQLTNFKEAPTFEFDSENDIARINLENGLAKQRLKDRLHAAEEARRIFIYNQKQRTIVIGRQLKKAPITQHGTLVHV